ncbi:hypothetical protein SARC_04760 [Sphaeroforma arctica JP610]|uniref:Uncharacterized protein n=1 Tax=Sphaeroforma arctica JP610 TaxID=667725 RepID=A0A0L0G1D7_9EUKA|nr:hypothetical protein SARC_04760 [Sphaeroforma arctica JP610]KNC82967.1 hypothetical protein SARC_04760 [Sphaeroforma arctica JP610]|eukprot:XP_014156869.1 hypothetical protein SARC_04760 [Sphaeroforma arctica JP610]
MLKGLRYDGRGQSTMMKKGVDQVAIAPPRMWINSNFTIDEMSTMSTKDALWDPIKKRSVALMFWLREDDEALVFSLADDIMNGAAIVVIHVLQHLAAGVSADVVKDLRTYGHLYMKLDARCTKDVFLTTCIHPSTGYLNSKLIVDASEFEKENHHLIETGYLYVVLTFESKVGKGISVAWRNPRTNQIMWDATNRLDPQLLHSMQIAEF